MIVLKTGRELKIMKEACSISAGALEAAGKAVEPGVTTAEIDRLAEEYIRRRGGEPNFKNYEGYPATACISINNEVIHGIPSEKRKLRAGDIVSIDLGAKFDGYHGDNAGHFRLRRCISGSEAADGHNARKPLRGNTRGVRGRQNR